MMNVGRRFFSNARRAWPVAASGLALLAGACAGVADYADFGETPVDRTSPASAAVVQALAEPADYPRFADIPKAPTDARPVSQWRAAVRDLSAEGEQARREGAQSTFSLNDSEAFAADARAEARPPGIAAPTAKEQQDSAAFAKALRERATPPPLAR